MSSAAVKAPLLSQMRQRAAREQGQPGLQPSRGTPTRFTPPGRRTPPPPPRPWPRSSPPPRPRPSPRRRRPRALARRLRIPRCACSTATASSASTPGRGEESHPQVPIAAAVVAEEVGRARQQGPRLRAEIPAIGRAAPPLARDGRYVGSLVGVQCCKAARTLTRRCSPQRSRSCSRRAATSMAPSPSSARSGAPARSRFELAPHVVDRDVIPPRPRR